MTIAFSIGLAGLREKLLLLKAELVSSAVKAFLLTTDFVPDPILGSEEKINYHILFSKGTFRILEYYSNIF